VPPFVEGSDDCQHLFVVDLIVPFNSVEGFGEESDRMELAIAIRQFAKGQLW
jgi:hypothetical protein